MDILFSPFALKGVKIKNRICMPPCVCYTFSDETGFVTDKNVAHYRNIARGGAGLIIQEATCIDPHGKLCRDQLGIWSDAHIPGLRRIVDAVHAEGAPIFLQLHHAGAVGVEEGEMISSSAVEVVHKKRLKRGREMTRAEIKSVQRAFADAAVRAVKAGYDGVELHGCHQYLICQFYNSRVNRRTDEYGEDPGLFGREVYRAVRAAVPEGFVVGMRLGAFEPTLEDGIAHARDLSGQGIDFLHISYGFSGQDEPRAPEGFPYMDVIYGAGEIKKNVSCAVFAVRSIRSAEDARGVLARTGVDMAAIGRGMLVNPAWANDAAAGRETGRCLECRECFWRIEPAACPGRKLYYRGGAD